MTLRELYASIDGSYDQAIAVLRVEKLIDKHIRRFPGGGVVDTVIAASERMDQTEMFESAHAMKGVCANLGLTALSNLAAQLCEEFRPGNGRRLSDGEVRERIEEIRALYGKTSAGIAEYVQSQT